METQEAGNSEVEAHVYEDVAADGIEVPRPRKGPVKVRLDFRIVRVE